jgi:uncharacterized protein with ParB-like and HNH nuclease domain
MATIDVTRALPTQSYKLIDYFSRPGAAFYIPIYQREYSWDKENVEQLIDDIFRGVHSLLDNSANGNSNKAIKFLGTIITVQALSSHEKVQLSDKRAYPTKIDIIIDGQQRLSTIALLATVLMEKIWNLAFPFLKEEPYSNLDDAVKKYCDGLLKIFALDLSRGEPRYKPIIIRERIDEWTYEGDRRAFYKSDIASYIAECIDIYIGGVQNKSKLQFPQIKRDSLIGENLHIIRERLKGIESTLSETDDSFPSAPEIIQRMDQSDLWIYERPDLVSHINGKDKSSENLFALVRLFAFTHYFLERCCFTVIESTSEEWAFDMFQSLNATGTPLTAIETFKPLVVNLAIRYSESEFKGSLLDMHFQKVENLMKEQKSVDKSKTTDAFLTTFALSYKGEKLGSQFSEQRKWLFASYPHEREKSDKREEFIRQMSYLAEYWGAIEQLKSGKQTISNLQDIDQKDQKETLLALKYLLDANHRIAHAVLSRFYSVILQQQQQGDAKLVKIAKTNFVGATRAVAAFFTLWRSARSNSGLDEVYRRLMKEKMSYEKTNAIVELNELREWFKKELNAVSIGDMNSWLSSAKTNLRYRTAPNKVIKFVLIVVACEASYDNDKPWLVTDAVQGIEPCLNLDKWDSSDLSSIEHIAPQKKGSDSTWDNNLYENETFNKIGNLTLLPGDINSSAGNRCWREKWYYYRYLAQPNPKVREQIIKEASNDGINLSSETLEVLKVAKYVSHIKPLVDMGNRSWDATVVDERTEAICKFLWRKMKGWLGEVQQGYLTKDKEE